MWSIAWLLLGGWVSTLAQILVIVFIVFAFKYGWRRAPLTAADFTGAGDFITPDGDLRTLPSQWPDIGGLDGFYAARLTRG